MPITIQCPGCKNEYSVADDLAGTTVNCRDCDTIIFVTEPGTIPLEDAVPAAEDGELSRCPACGKLATIIDDTCMTCGFNLLTGKSMELPTMDLGGPFPVGAKSSRYRRRRDWGTFGKVDRFIFSGMLVLLLASLFAWIVRISWRAGTFSFHVMMPTLLLLLVVFGVIVPGMVLAIRWMCHWLRRPVREDLYVRAGATLAFPIVIGFCFGGVNDLLCENIMVAGWVLTPVLFVYLFRAGIGEWIGSLAAGVLALVVVCGGVWFLAFLMPGVTGAFARETLPRGPWEVLATGQPVPRVSIATTAVAATNPETQVAIDTTPAESPAVDTAPAVVKPAVKPAVPRIVQSVPIPVPIPATILPRKVMEKATVAMTAPAKAAEPVVTRVEGLADITAYPGLQNVQRVIVNDIASDYFLVVRAGGEGEVVAERWSAGTMEKTGEVRFQELPREPHDYAICPSGAVLVSLSRFPTNELQISGFDKNSTVRKISLDQKGILGTPRLAGFIDPAHFIIRWDGRNGILQMWTIDGGRLSHAQSDAMGEDVNQWALSPNPGRVGAKLAALLPGQTAAATSVSQIYVGMIDGWTLVQRFTPRTSVFTAAGMAFSGDANDIGICALTSDGGTVMTFDLQTDSNLQTIVFPASAYPRPMAHGLVWLTNSDLLLVGGNVLYDSVSGKRAGTLGVQNIVDAHNLGAGTLLLVQDGGDGVKNGLVVKMNAGLGGAGRGEEK